MNYTTFLYRDIHDRSELYCEDVPVTELATKFGTPLYVYSQKQIENNFRSFQKAIKQSGERNYVSYAIKANSNVEILRLLAEEGAGASVVSGGELLAALKAGFGPSKITFDGPGKTDDEIILALRSDIFAIDIESLQELHVVNDLAGKLGVRARICIRVNPHIDAKTHPYISTGLSENKFGITIDDSIDAYRIARDLPNIETIGIHCHIGSQITDISVFVEAAESIVRFVEKLKKNERIVLKHINFGGGQAVEYHNIVASSFLLREEERHSKIFSFEDLTSAVMPLLLQTGCTVNVEPGRSIVANSCALISKVLFTKSNTDKNFVILDAGMNDLIRPSLYQAYHQIVPLSLQKKNEEVVANIVGPICETGDFFAHDRLLPNVDRGDILAVMCAGAYGYVLASNYNLRPRATEVLVDSSSSRIIRERENIENII